VSRGITTSNNARVMATDDKYLELRNLKLNDGRIISFIDIEQQSKICIIGKDVKESLFNLANPIGETIKLEGDNYLVVGILEETGTSMGTNFDNSVLIPITSAKHLGSDTMINNLYIKIEDENNIDVGKMTIENYIMRKLQLTNDYISVSSQSQMLDTMESINNTFAILLGGIASISLVVGGIGVMNVMLVSVTERIREIGVRKSLGARRIDILFQFLVEAMVLSFFGGLLGVIIGIILRKIILFIRLYIYILKFNCIISVWNKYFNWNNIWNISSI